jgi:hypothetical protein
MQLLGTWSIVHLIIKKLKYGILHYVGLVYGYMNMTIQRDEVSPAMGGDQFLVAFQ